MMDGKMLVHETRCFWSTIWRFATLDILLRLLAFLHRKLLKWYSNSRRRFSHSLLFQVRHGQLREEAKKSPSRKFPVTSHPLFSKNTACRFKTTIRLSKFSTRRASRASNAGDTECAEHRRISMKKLGFWRENSQFYY